MGEDHCRTRRDNGPENLATVRRLVLNCIRKAKTGKSVPRSMRAAVMDTEELRKIHEQAFSS